MGTATRISGLGLADEIHRTKEYLPRLSLENRHLASAVCQIIRQDKLLAGNFQYLVPCMIKNYGCGNGGSQTEQLQELEPESICQASGDDIRGMR